MSRSIFLKLTIAVACSAFGSAPSLGQDVDVYLITGQSNAGNFAKEAGLGTGDLGFTMHFARSSDNFTNFPNHTGVAQAFTSSTVNATRATSILASELHQEGRDVAIFTFARIGAGLHLNTSGDGNGWIWYPGDDPAAGVFYNDSLYINSINWFQTRIGELVANGYNPTVKGMFWFQGEKDGRLGDHDVYEQNFDNLVARFRQDFGASLPFVTTQIREVTDTAANREAINGTLEQAAAEDPRMAFVQTEDLTFRSATDVHLNSSGHASLSPRWADAMIGAQNSLLLGDCNLDGVVNFLDINPFIGILADDAYLEEADCNQDGVVTFLDINPFIGSLSSN